MNYSNIDLVDFKKNFIEQIKKAVRNNQLCSNL